mmetsp:Transcript_14210/g.33762  ORF Transcript_14210/g.33762 Transcript_14210/m.33762 type:complete len:213 (-) Transcript_14210:158-796(-)
MEVLAHLEESVVLLVHIVDELAAHSGTNHSIGKRDAVVTMAVGALVAASERLTPHVDADESSPEPWFQWLWQQAEVVLGHLGQCRHVDGFRRAVLPSDGWLAHKGSLRRRLGLGCRLGLCLCLRFRLRFWLGRSLCLGLGCRLRLCLRLGLWLLSGLSLLLCRLAFGLPVRRDDCLLVLTSVILCKLIKGVCHTVLGINTLLSRRHGADCVS